MRGLKRLSSYRIWLFLVLLSLPMMPGLGEAGSITIWPDQLQPTGVYGPAIYQSIEEVFGSAAVVFYAPVKLPVGATITSVTYYHLGYGSPANTNVSLFRVKFGQTSEMLAYGSSTDASGSITEVPVSITGAATVQGGYRYGVTAASFNSDSAIRGIKIKYR